jgi:heme-degrading monooxygenase HmoA
MYTSGVWYAKPGTEDEFARSWQASVDRLSVDLPGVTFRLLRDTEDPLRFVSVVGPWRNREQFEATRNSEEFVEQMTAMMDVLESYEIRAYDPVVEVS